MYKLTWFNRATGWKVEEKFDHFNQAKSRADVLNLLGHEVQGIEGTNE